MTQNKLCPFSIIIAQALGVYPIDGKCLRGMCIAYYYESNPGKVNVAKEYLDTTTIQDAIRARIDVPKCKLFGELPREESK